MLVAATTTMEVGVAEWKGEKIRKVPFWLTNRQINWLDHQKADRITEVAESLEPGQEMEQVSRSTVVREWIDEQIAAGQ